MDRRKGDERRNNKKMNVAMDKRKGYDRRSGYERRVVDIAMEIEKRR
ncbi:hypothetical protein ACFL50_03900 [Candidatus Latescibacterota bacterium]